MEEYKKYVISKGGKELGLLWQDIKQHLLTPQQYQNFNEFMTGQTCCAIEHIDDDDITTFLPLVYTGDYLRFIKGLPVID